MGPGFRSEAEQAVLASSKGPHLEGCQQPGAILLPSSVLVVLELGVQIIYGLGAREVVAVSLDGFNLDSVAAADIWAKPLSQ